MQDATFSEILEAAKLEKTKFCPENRDNLVNNWGLELIFGYVVDYKMLFLPDIFFFF